MDKETAVVVALFVGYAAIMPASAQSVIGTPNPEPVIEPGTDMNRGREAPSRRSPEQALVGQLRSYLEAYVRNGDGQLPTSWDQVEKKLGIGMWESTNEREIIKRRFAFIGSSGGVPQSHDNGPLAGKLVLAPLYPLKEPRSEEQGRFTVWQSEKGAFAARWLTESELKTFSNWSEVETKLEAAKAAVALMPPLAIESTPAPQSRSVPPIESASVAAAPSGSPMPTAPVAQTPALPAERKSPVWPWLVGIAALIAIVAVALKRRA